MIENMKVRRFKEEDAQEVRNLIVRNFLEVNSKDYGKRQTMRLTLNETPLFYERRGFLHSSGSSDDQGIRSSNSAGSIFPCLSQRFGSSVRIYLK